MISIVGDPTSAPGRDAARPEGREDALREYGYGSPFAEAFAAASRRGEVPARVVEERRGGYRIVLRAPAGGIEEADAFLAGSLAGEALSASELPAVGDWAIARPSPGGPAALRGLLPRRSAFMRKAPGELGRDKVDAQVIAANVDTVFIVAAAGRDWNPRRVERYLALVAAAGAEPFLVIAKADLADDPEGLLAEAAAAAPGVRTALACALDGRGLESISAALRPGATIVLAGSSGAGKSTLLNALGGAELARTGEVREDDQRGRHTTTGRRLYRLPSGALAIDTPGMRELQLWADEDDVGGAFPEIDALAAACRFADCRHESEPGCAVLSALGEGRLEIGRYESWRKLTREVAYLRRREDGSAREAERRRWKGIEKSRRAFAKEASRSERER